MFSSYYFRLISVKIEVLILLVKTQTYFTFLSVWGHTARCLFELHYVISRKLTFSVNGGY